ncbi:hypothetical protein HNY73_016115 [Argiope bruennichi]|uniref:Uncharacterized protein n=1 Tax=Argiope bruennichi TaxID=94029 RepID=A0A8T0EIV3_ARGBR|nr:hypothetical protein HNY73_016115 [Argiope bruennichi]
MIRGFILIMTFLLQYTLPVVIAVLISSLYYNTGRQFSSVLENVEHQMNLGFHQENMSELLQRYSFLYQLAHDVEKALSIPSFSLLCWQWLDIYLVLVTSFKIDNSSFSSALYWENIVRLTFGSLIVIGVVSCASVIPSRVCEIKKCLQLILNSLLRDVPKNYENIQLVSSMINTEFPQMTACGVAELKPTLILTYFGSLLTYARSPQRRDDNLWNGNVQAGQKRHSVKRRRCDIIRVAVGTVNGEIILKFDLIKYLFYGIRLNREKTPSSIENILLFQEVHVIKRFDGRSPHNAKFSTKDADNDNQKENNCALKFSNQVNIKQLSD